MNPAPIRNALTIDVEDYFHVPPLRTTSRAPTGTRMPCRVERSVDVASPFYPEGDRGLLEIPVTTVRLFNRNLLAGGGGYFRLLPYSVSRWWLKRVNTIDRQPCIFCFHPWEIDPGQPRQSGISLKTRFRHYVNLSEMEGRIRALLGDFQWDRMDRVFVKFIDESARA
jgi:hypothetical protein